MHTERQVRGHIERKVRVLTLVTGQRAHRKTGHCAQKGTGQSAHIVTVRENIEIQVRQKIER